MLGRIRLLAIASILPSVAAGATLQVGAAKTYAKPCAAFAVAKAGDTVEIDRGTYTEDACVVGSGKDGLVIRGVNGRAKMDATGYEISNGKAIWVIDSDSVTVENIEFAGASVPDMNGAGIRIEANHSIIRNCYFHDNENGILGGPPTEGTGELLIEYSEFDHNGLGDGCSHGGCAHNIYVGRFAKFTLQFSWSHDVEMAHLAKTRAYESYILYNRIGSEGNTTASIEIDIPNGGAAYVIGNTIQKDGTAGNGALLAFAEEGASNPTQRLFMVANTLVNGKSSTFLNVPSGFDASGVVNNIFVGSGNALSNGVLPAANMVQQDPLFINAAAYDYHLSAGSPALGKAVAVAPQGEVALTPRYEYVHPLRRGDRTSEHDFGAFELGTNVNDAGSSLGDSGRLGTGGSGGSGGATGGGGEGGGGPSTGGGGRGGSGAGQGAGGASQGAGGGSGGASTGRGAAGTEGGGAGAATSGGQIGGLELTDGAAPGGAVPMGQSSGCGCRCAGQNSRPEAGWVALILGAVLVRRGRRSQYEDGDHHRKADHSLPSTSDGLRREPEPDLSHIAR